MRCHISGCENVKVSISPPGLVRSNTVRARAVNNGKKRGKTATRSFLPFTHYSQNVKPRKIETLANGRKNKVYSKWIPFGRHIMIAVKHNWGKESRGEADRGARTHRQTDRHAGDGDRQAERDTCCCITCCNNSVDIQMKSSDNRSRLRQHPVCK